VAMPPQGRDTDRPVGWPVHGDRGRPLIADARKRAGGTEILDRLARCHGRAFLLKQQGGVLTQRPIHWLPLRTLRRIPANVLSGEARLPDTARPLSQPMQEPAGRVTVLPASRPRACGLRPVYAGAGRR